MPSCRGIDANAKAGDVAAMMAATFDSERARTHGDHARRLKASVQGRRGRPERDDESKLEILDYWEARGIEATKDHFGLDERTLRRYIADAKKIREGER